MLTKRPRSTAYGLRQQLSPHTRERVFVSLLRILRPGLGILSIDLPPERQMSSNDVRTLGRLERRPGVSFSRKVQGARNRSRKPRRLLGLPYIDSCLPGPMGFSEIEEVVSAGEQLMDAWFLLSDSQYSAWLHHAAAHDVRSPSGNCERIGLVSGETNIDQALVRLDR